MNENQERARCIVRKSRDHIEGPAEHVSAHLAASIADVEQQPHRHRPRRLRCGIDEESALAIGGEGKHGEEIFVFQIRKVGEDFRFAHACGEIGEDIVDGDAEPANAGLAAPFAGLDGDAVRGVHTRRLGGIWSGSKASDLYVRQMVVLRLANEAVG